MCRALFVILLMMGSPVEASPPSSDVGAEGWTTAEILQRADDLADEKKFKEAAYLYRRFISENPARADAILGLARCVEHVEGPEHARELFRQALVLDPNLEEAKRWLQEDSSPIEQANSGGEIPVSAPLDQPADVAVDRPQAKESTREVEQAAEAPSLEASPGSGNAVVAEEPVIGATLAEATGPESGQATSAGEDPLKKQGEIAAVTDRQGDAAVGGMIFVVMTVALGLAVVTLIFVLVWRHRRSCTVRGLVERFPLADLLQWLSIGQKEGHLKISTRAGQGHIYLRAGSLYRAEFGSLTGKDAVFEILSLARGRFEFREEILSPHLQKNLDVPVPQILMSWAYETDESNRETVDEASMNIQSIDDSTLNIDLPF